MPDRETLEKALAVQESLRGSIPDEIVDAAIAAIEQQLAELAAPTNEKQRKQVTILFADVVSSTRLGEQFDPEDVMAILDGGLRRFGEAVQAHAGHVARFMGDGMLAFFGVPKAHEDDPERAIRAGLAILTTAQTYSQEVRDQWGIDTFAVRVGINTGPVVLGAMGGANVPDFTAMGDAVNLAARLESAAPKNSLLIGQTTYKLVRGLFEVKALPPIEVKGKTEPVQAYVVERGRPPGTNPVQRGVDGIQTALVGRDREMSRLQAVRQQTLAARQPHMVTLVGEAGVGKSRLLSEFMDWHKNQSEMFSTFTGRCHPQTQNDPQFLLRSLLANRFQIRDSDSLAVVQQKFIIGLTEILSGESTDITMKAHILGTWLGYDFPDTVHTQPFRNEPDQLKNRATLYLTQLFSAVLHKGPVVLILEDIHWADNGSLAAVRDLIRRLSPHALLIMCLARSSLFEKQPQWGTDVPNHTRLNLHPLSGASTLALVGELLRRLDPLPSTLLELVSARAAGNPFYAEELINMLIDDGTIVTDDDIWRIIPTQLDALQVPNTLTGVLQARLDRLPASSKQAAQQAAVIGQIFWDQALALLDARGPAALPTLQARALIIDHNNTTFAGMDEFAFKHALLRDVIYETVLKKRRRRYHAQVGKWLAATATANGRVEEFAAMIGNHFRLGRQEAEAATWYEIAGRHAAARFGHEEAIEYFTHSLAMIPANDKATEFRVRLARERAYDNRGDRTAQQAELEQLAALAKNLGFGEQTTVTLRQAELANVTSHYQQSITFAQSAVRLAKIVGDDKLLGEGHWRWGTALSRQGLFSEAKIQMKRSLIVARACDDQDRIATCLMGMGVVASQEGHYESAGQYEEQALLMYRDLDNMSGEAWALASLGINALLQEDLLTAKRYNKQASNLAQAMGDRLFAGFVDFRLAVLAARMGDYTRSNSYGKKALATFVETGERNSIGSAYRELGHTAYYQGNYEQAKQLAEKALRIHREVSRHVYEAVSLNLLGVIALALSDMPAAESYFRQALAIREEIDDSARFVEDWAGLAQVNIVNGDHDEARQLIGQIMGHLRENPRLTGVDNPMQTFRLAWGVLDALGRNEDAYDILTKAAKRMMLFLGKNHDPLAQEMYLAQPHHQPLWQAWNRLQSQ